MPHAQAMREFPAIMADITYLAAADERPVYYPNPHVPPAGKPRHSGTFEQRTMEVQNIRLSSIPPQFFDNGFEFVPHRSGVRSFYDRDELARVYKPELEELMKSRFGATDVYVFDHSWRTRVNEDDRPGPQKSFRRGEGSFKRPFPRAHGDFTERTAHEMLKVHTGLDAPALSGRSFSIVNIWRPIVGPLRDQPLALCDAATVGDDDLTVCDIVYPDRRSELFDVSHNENHRWYYAPDMSNAEAWVFSTYRSNAAGGSVSVPHCAIDPQADGAPILPRESIESRLIAIF